MPKRKVNLLWAALLVLFFLRPFISQRCYPHLDLYYSLGLLLCFLLWYLFNPELSPQDPLGLPMFLFFSALFISTLFSLNCYWSLGEIYSFIVYAGAFYLMARINLEQKKQLIFTLVLAACLVALYGVYQFFWGLQHTLDYLARIQPYPYAQEFLSRKRAFATFLSPDVFAAYLVMVLPLTAGVFLEGLSKRRHPLLIFAGLSIIFILASLFLTKSVGGWLGLFTVLLSFSILLFMHYPLLRPKAVSITVVSALLIMAALVGIFIIRSGSFFEFNSPHNSIVQRSYFWLSAVKIIRSFPLTGVGLDNFGWFYPDYKSPQAIATWFVHNSYLQLWAEAGILGIAGWLWLAIGSFRLGLKKLKVSPEVNYLLVGLLAASVGFLIHNLIDFSFFLPEVALHWWVIAGLISFWPEKSAENCASVRKPA